MSYLKLIFNFVKYSIISNPAKIIMIVLSTIAINWAGTLKGEYDYIHVTKQFKDGDTYVYISKDSDNDYEVYTSDKQELKNGKIPVWDEPDGKILLWILSVIMIIIVSIGTIVGALSDDDEVAWDFSDAYENALHSLIYCEYEDGNYHYMIMGRLIEIRKNRTRHFDINRLSDVYRLPKYSTKTQRRNNILDKLGI